MRIFNMLLGTVHATILLLFLSILTTANEFDTYGAVITTLNDALLTLDLAILTLTMSPKFDWIPLERAFQVVLEVAKNGTNTLTAMQVVDDDDATNVVVTASTVASMVNTVMVDFSKSLVVIEENRETMRVLAFLDKFQAQSEVLVGFLVNKSPTQARDIVKNMLDPVAFAVADGIKAFGTLERPLRRRFR
jgi:hypothetical protein